MSDEENNVIDLILTEEQKAKLKEAGALGFNVSDSFPYVPEAYRVKDTEGNFIIPKELWCVFTLKSKDGIQVAEAEDKAGYMTFDQNQKESKYVLQSGKARVENLASGILAVKNLHCEDGSTISFSKERKLLITKNTDGIVKEQPGATIQAVIKKMKGTLQLEIANAINERSMLTEEEVQGLGY